MASNKDIQGITIKIQGDTSGLATSLQKVNKEINTTQKALKDVEKALELDPNNVELLAQKQALLAKQTEQVTEKLNLEKEAAENAKQALELGDITAEEYATLQAEIVRTESSLSDLSDTAGEASGEMEDVGDSAESAGESASESSVDFEAWGEAVVVAAEAAAAAVAAVGAALAAAGTALVNATIETSQFADDVMTMSSVTGIATDTLQEMNYASELLDVSTDTITGSMTKLIRSMSSAQDGTGATAEAFAQLGIDITDADGNLRDSEEVFWDAIDALGQIENETERDAAAMSLFGRSARELNPLIEAGSDAFADLAQEAHDAGYVMDGETLDAFGALDDNMQRLTNGTTALEHAFGQVLLPVLTDLSGDGVDFLNNFTNAVLDTNGDVGQLADVIEEMLPQAIDIFNEYLPIVLELGTSVLSTLVDGILSNLDLILNSALDLILAIADGIINYLPQLLPSVIAIIDRIVMFLLNNIGTIVNAAVEIVVAVARGITDNLDTLIPAVIDAIFTIQDALLDNLDVIIEAGLELCLGLGQGLIEQGIPRIVQRIPEAIASIIDAFAQLGTMLAQNASEWGADMIQAIINGITSMASNLASTVSSVAETIASYLHFSEPDVGPLSDFSESGGDMIETFIQGMNSEKGDLERALYQTSDIIYYGMTGADYSDALSGISGQLSGMGGQQVINVWLGTDRLGSVVVGAQNMENFRTGGTA